MLRIGKIHTTLVVWYTYKPFSCRCWPVGLLETSLLTCWGYGRLFLEEDLLALILLVVCATTLGTTPPLLILSLHVILLSPLVLQKQLTTLLLIQYMQRN